MKLSQEIFIIRFTSGWESAIKEYRPTNRHAQSNMHNIFFEGGHKEFMIFIKTRILRLNP